MEETSAEHMMAFDILLVSVARPELLCSCFSRAFLLWAIHLLEFVSLLVLFLHILIVYSV